MYAIAYLYYASKLASRYVLFDDGTFALQFSSTKFGLVEYVGTYDRADSSIYFHFRNVSSWNAEGRLDGNTMKVSYDPFMRADGDFINGLYILAP